MYLVLLLVRLLREDIENCFFKVCVSFFYFLILGKMCFLCFVINSDWIVIILRIWGGNNFLLKVRI